MAVCIQIAWLLLLPLPIACIAWTFTHEEIFREPREYCSRQSIRADSLFKRKFFFIFTCEYCFSHYVTIFFLFLTHYKLLMDDWTGYLISGFAVVWIANIYISLYGFLRQNIKKEKTEIKVLEKKSEEPY